jgi:hypothetical protein
MPSKTIAISLAFVIMLLEMTFNFPAYAGPTSSTYELKEYGFGAGGIAGATSEKYSLMGVAGEAESGKASSDTYEAGAGLVYTHLANVPPAPSFTNPGNANYNKLKLIINNGDNPDDTKFAIAISTDNFISETKYVQNDQSIGSLLGPEDWQTYDDWGNTEGFWVLGLDPGTTYSVKVTAYRGNFTQSAYGPTAQAITSNPTFSFDLDVSPTNNETDPPFSVPIGELDPAVVKTSTDKVWADVNTNGSGGATIYIYGSNNGLKSATNNYTITSSTGDLDLLTEGYGARGTYANQTSGGPMEIVFPFNKDSNIIGAIDTTKKLIFDSSGNNVTAGRVSFELKAKASAVTKSGGDYGDTITVIAAATY